MVQHTPVLVIGAGPIGAVAALAQARRGRTVVVLEASPAAAAKRFAGELLHPRALRALADAGAPLPPELGVPVPGFSVFVDGHTHALDYPDAPGRTLPFADLVAHLRTALRAHPQITLLDGWRVTSICGQAVTARTPDGTAKLTSETLIDAGGRNSPGRRALDLSADLERLSLMAGLELHGVTLPFEGRGHVVLAPHGPALIYRIGPDRIRVCLDVPSPWRRSWQTRLGPAYADALPPGLRDPILAELDAGRVEWAVNGVRARTCFGRPGLALVGDAAGVVHPMTAVGMTLGFADALALADATSLDSWAAARAADDRVPALLATALYEIFAVDRPAPRALRAAVFDLWRSPHLRDRTMRFLAADDTSLPRFVGTGVQLVARATAHLARGPAPLLTAARVAGLVRWLLADAVPRPMQLPGLRVGATPFAAERRAVLMEVS